MLRFLLIPSSRFSLFEVGFMFYLPLFMFYFPLFHLLPSSSHLVFDMRCTTGIFIDGDIANAFFDGINDIADDIHPIPERVFAEFRFRFALINGIVNRLQVCAAGLTESLLLLD